MAAKNNYLTNTFELHHQITLSFYVVHHITVHGLPRVFNHGTSHVEVSAWTFQVFAPFSGHTRSSTYFCANPFHCLSFPLPYHKIFALFSFNLFSTPSNFLYMQQRAQRLPNYLFKSSIFVQLVQIVLFLSVSYCFSLFCFLNLRWYLDFCLSAGLLPF